MRRLTIPAKQLEAGDTFSLTHHALYQGTVETVTGKGSTVRVRTDGHTHTLDSTHLVTIYRHQ